MNVFCVVVDGLQAAYLGTYGNAWVGTPHLDALAADGFVFDQAFVTCPSLAAFYRGAWFGRPAITHLLEDAPPPSPSLLEVLGKAGFQTLLVTDEPQLVTVAGAADFAAQVVVGPANGQVAGALDRPEVAEAAETDDETAMASTIAAALDAWQQSASAGGSTAPRNHCVWIHLRGLLGNWDAPYVRRAKYADEDDPPPPQWVAPPHRTLDEHADPDELLGIRQAYAGQIAALDSLFGSLWSVIAATSEPSLLCLMGCRGYPLGIHRRLGYPTDEPAQLYAETVQMPWIMRFPDAMHAGGRTQALAEPADLPATLLEACMQWDTTTQVAVPATWERSLMPVVAGDETATRDRLLLAAPSPKSAAIQSLRTAAWSLIESKPGKQNGTTQAGESAYLPNGSWELYAKPDDRWEINEVSARMPDIAERMSALAREQRRVLLGEARELSPLDEDLRNIHR